MVKFLITALALGAFATTGIPGQAQAQPRHAHCLKAPKDPVPCPNKAQASQQLKPQVSR